MGDLNIRLSSFDAGPSPFDVQLLRVFPLGTGKEVDVALPMAVRPLTVADDGETRMRRPPPDPTSCSHHAAEF